MEPNLEILNKILQEVKGKKFLNDMQADIRKREEKKKFKKLKKEILTPKSKPLY